MSIERVQTYISTLQQTLDEIPKGMIVDVIATLQEARMQGKQVFIMGNGGSASTATHFVCDLAKNTRRAGLPHFRVIGLTDNMAIFSAYANDEGYESVFAQQLANLIQPGDVVIGISASGNSQNIINGMLEACKHEATTIAFTGYDGGRLGPMVDFNLYVPSNIIEHVEDIHLVLEHMIVLTIKQQTHPEEQIVTSIAEMAEQLQGD